MGGIRLIKWIELEPPLESTDTTQYLAEFKNDFDEVWIKNIQVRVQAIRNPAEQPIYGNITVTIPDQWHDYVMPQGVFGCHIHIATRQCPPGEYRLSLKIEYDIAVERMSTSSSLEPSFDVVIA
jgi:hypothetical protein